MSWYDETGFEELMPKWINTPPVANVNVGGPTVHNADPWSAQNTRAININSSPVAHVNVGGPSVLNADPWSAQNADGGYAPSVDAYGPPTEADFMESLKDVAFAGYEVVPSWAGSWAGSKSGYEGGITNTAGYAQRQGFGEAHNEEGRGLMGRITDFINNNKSLTEMLIKGVGGSLLEKEKQKGATKLLREKENIELERNKRYSDSVRSLARPGHPGQAKPLRRVDGSRVFNNNGRII